MNLPAEFVKNIHNAFPLEADRWLASLPELLEEAAQRWDLQIGEPFLLSYNYVCAATQADGTPAVLKIGVPNRELTSEINTLTVYNGQGACQIYAAKPERGMLLEERLFPGTMLVTLEDDDQATETAAKVMKQTHRPVPQQEGFLSLKGWFDELKKLRPHFHGGTGPFPEKSFAMAEGLIQELFAEDRPQVLLARGFPSLQYSAVGERLVGDRSEGGGRAGGIRGGAAAYEPLHLYTGRAGSHPADGTENRHSRGGAGFRAGADAGMGDLP